MSERGGLVLQTTPTRAGKGTVSRRPPGRSGRLGDSRLLRRFIVPTASLGPRGASAPPRRPSDGRPSQWLGSNPQLASAAAPPLQATELRRPGKPCATGEKSPQSAVWYSAPDAWLGASPPAGKGKEAQHQQLARPSTAGLATVRETSLRRCRCRFREASRRQVVVKHTNRLRVAIGADASRPSAGPSMRQGLRPRPASCRHSPWERGGRPLCSSGLFLECVLAPSYSAKALAGCWSSEGQICGCWTEQPSLIRAGLPCRPAAQRARWGAGARSSTNQSASEDSWQVVSRRRRGSANVDDLRFGPGAWCAMVALQCDRRGSGGISLGIGAGQMSPAGWAPPRPGR